MSSQNSLICQQKFKRVTVEEKLSFVRKRLHQPCKKLKPLNDYTGKTRIPKVFASLQKQTDIYSQVKDALTKRVIFFFNNHTITFF